MARRGWFVAAIALLAVRTAQPQAGTPATLSASELRGKKVFLQRCSICHLPPLYEPPEVKPYGPLLGGYLRSPQMETRARTAIRQGTPRMPGFQYTLQPNEIDDVIAYMKTMKAASAAASAPGAPSGNTERTGD